MSIFLTLLLLLAMGATLFMLVKGIIIFLKSTEADLKSDGSGPSASSLRQNKAMFGRILFQGVAILIIVLLLLAKGSN